MRDELLKGGVYVDDRRKTWTTTDGRSGTITRNGGTCNSGVAGAYGQSAQSAAHYGQDPQQQQAAWAAYYQAQGQPQYPGYYPYPGR